MSVPSPDITIRPSTKADGVALARLAELDSQHLSSGSRWLVAEVGDELVAAVDSTGDSAIADPFRRTSDVIELLRMRARPERGRRLRLLPRTA